MNSKTSTHLAREYRALNGTQYDVLERPPSALEFSRLVHISRPVLIKAPAAPAASAKWTPAYLLARMAEHPVSIAVTPAGQGADALATGPDGTTYFAEPHVETMPLRAFLARLAAPAPADAETLYLQSQNGNLYPAAPSEFAPLLPDVPPDVAWATEALGRAPEAVNIWIGDARSVTSVHCDPYENIYTVVLGTKHFTLFPPTEGPLLRERTYPHARYTRPAPGAPLTLTPSGPPVRWASSPRPAPREVAVRAGETLYLPPGWWHGVRQSGALCVALNWWYDMEMRGMQAVWLAFLRGVPDTEGEEGEEEGVSV